MILDLKWNIFFQLQRLPTKETDWNKLILSIVWFGRQPPSNLNYHKLVVADVLIRKSYVWKCFFYSVEWNRFLYY